MKNTSKILLTEWLFLQDHHQMRLDELIYFFFVLAIYKPAKFKVNNGWFSVSFAFSESHSIIFLKPAVEYISTTIVTKYVFAPCFRLCHFVYSKLK